MASLSTGETYTYDANGNTPALHRTHDMSQGDKSGASVRINSTLYYTLKDHPSAPLRTALRLSQRRDRCQREYFRAE